MRILLNLILLQFLFISYIKLIKSNSNECINTLNNELNNKNIPKNIKLYYKEGKKECLNYLKNLKFEEKLLNEITQPYIHINYNQGPRQQCRGLSMLYKLTKQLPWIFGPKNCSTYKSCWTGILTCSLDDSNSNNNGFNEHFNRIETFKKSYQSIIDENLKNSELSTNRWNSLKFTGWSLKSLRLQMRLSGLSSPCNNTFHL